MSSLDVIFASLGLVALGAIMVALIRWDWRKR